MAVPLCVSPINGDRIECCIDLCEAFVSLAASDSRNLRGLLELVLDVEHSFKLLRYDLQGNIEGISPTQAATIGGNSKLAVKSECMPRGSCSSDGIQTIDARQESKEKSMPQRKHAVGRQGSSERMLDAPGCLVPSHGPHRASCASWQPPTPSLSNIFGLKASAVPIPSASPSKIFSVQSSQVTLQTSQATLRTSPSTVFSPTASSKLIGGKGSTIKVVNHMESRKAIASAIRESIKLRGSAIRESKERESGLRVSVETGDAVLASVMQPSGFSGYREQMATLGVPVSVVLASRVPSVITLTAIGSLLFSDHAIARFEMFLWRMRKAALTASLTLVMLYAVFRNIVPHGQQIGMRIAILTSLAIVYPLFTLLRVEVLRLLFATITVWIMLFLVIAGNMLTLFDDDYAYHPSLEEQLYVFVALIPIYVLSCLSDALPSWIRRLLNKYFLSLIVLQIFYALVKRNCEVSNWTLPCIRRGEMINETEWTLILLFSHMVLNAWLHPNCFVSVPSVTLEVVSLPDDVPDILQAVAQMFLSLIADKDDTTDSFYNSEASSNNRDRDATTSKDSSHQSQASNEPTLIQCSLSKSSWESDASEVTAITAMGPSASSSFSSANHVRPPKAVSMMPMIPLPSCTSSATLNPASYNSEGRKSLAASAIREDSNKLMSTLMKAPTRPTLATAILPQEPQSELC